MEESTLGQILLNDRLIDKDCLVKALRQQEQFLQQSNWKLLGEIFVESGDISHKDLGAALSRQAKLFDIELFALHPHPSVQSRFKRSLDILGAIVGLALMLILLPPIALAIVIDSPGPIFSVQHRVGLRGRQFRIWKFRTTVQNAKPAKLKNSGKQQHKFFDIRNDSQITRVNKFLRKTHLDELPQFFNVLRGEMSLVGTRPPTLNERKTYSQEDWQRLSIKPGMTGLWQISRRKYSTSFKKIVQLDMAYIRAWRPILDLKVIFKTIIQIVFGNQQGLIVAPNNSVHKAKVPILNLEIDNLSKVQFLQQLDNGVVFTPNVDHLMKLQRDQEFFQAYSQADFKACDSQILMYASRFLGQPIQEKVSGSDFFPEFCKFHKDNESIQVFLLGGAKGVAKKAQTKINKRLGRKIIIGAHSPSFGFVENSGECRKIVEKINQCQPSVLAVCLGAPKQEKWIYRYKDQLPSVNIFLAMGATVDFEAGYKMRAPQWVSNLGFEWLFRLLLEPRRLWKRYLFDDLPFIWLLLKQRLGFYKKPFVIREK